MTVKNKESENPVVKYLGALKNETRVAIVQILSRYENPIEFSEIKRELEESFGITPNLSYHLNILKEHLIVAGDEQGYELTDLGQKTRSFLHSVEEVVNPEKSIRIRTSKYGMEFFDETIIEKNLQKEANMPATIAKEIATEAKKRLKKAKVTYLTAPLVREYINAILIENHHEYYRAKLTRLGVPPYDISLMLKSGQCSSPKEMKDFLARQVMEQYVLLNTLQRKYADAFLTGDFLFANLESFGTNPLELIITGEQFASILTKFYYFLKSNADDYDVERDEFKKFKTGSIKSDIIFTDLSFVELLALIQFYFKLIAPFFPEGFNILRFDAFLEKYLNNQSEIATDKSNIKKLEYLIKYWNPFSQSKWKITLQISLIANFADLNPLFEIYLKDYQKINQKNSQIGIESSVGVKNGSLPNLIIHGQKSEIKPLLNGIESGNLNSFYHLLISILPHPQVKLDQYSKWGWPNVEHIYTNIHIPIAVENVSQFKPAVVIEKISINLLRLYVNSNFDLGKFWKELEIAIFQVFNFFEEKYNRLYRLLSNFSDWKILQELIFSESNEKTGFIPYGRMIGAVSFHGLEEMILLHSGLFLRMQEKNRQLAVKILDFMQKLLDKQNAREKNLIHYVLAESHPQKELITPSTEIFTEVNKKASKLLGKEYSHPSYLIGFSNANLKLSNETLIKIFSDLQASSFKELTIRLKLPKKSTSSKIDGRIKDFSSETLELFKKLLSLSNFLLDISVLSK